jgi:hypothetical protein
VFIYLFFSFFVFLLFVLFVCMPLVVRSLHGHVRVDSKVGLGFAQSRFWRHPAARQNDATEAPGRPHQLQIGQPQHFDWYLIFFSFFFRKKEARTCNFLLLVVLLFVEVGP